MRTIFNTGARPLFSTRQLSINNFIVYSFRASRVIRLFLPLPLANVNNCPGDIQPWPYPWNLSLIIGLDIRRIEISARRRRASPNAVRAYSFYCRPVRGVRGTIPPGKEGWNCEIKFTRAHCFSRGTSLKIYRGFRLNFWRYFRLNFCTP